MAVSGYLVETQTMERSVRWRPATATELEATLLPAQLQLRQGAVAQCSFPFKHGCPGMCRNSLMEISPQSAARIAETDDAQDPLSGLRALLSGPHVSAPRCGLSFIGDSVSSDGWAAALVGALKLGFSLGHCSNSAAAIVSGLASAAGGATRPASAKRYMEHENRTFCNQRPKPAWDPSSIAVFSPAARGATSGCSSLSIRHVLPGELFSAHGGALLREVLTTSFAIIMNEGLHANSPAEHTILLEKRVRPLLVAASALPAQARARVLWRETTPQHFTGSSKSGLHSEKSHAFMDLARCSAIGRWEGETDASERTRKALQRSNWRNSAFARWRRNLTRAARNSTSHSTRDLGAVIDGVLPMHALLASRFDLKAPPDCTHFCFSPFVWTPVWRDAARLLRKRSAP